MRHSQPPRVTTVSRARWFTTLVALSALCACTNKAQAWGADGHRLVAAHAYALLSPQARERVDALLALEPAATLSSISTWADETCTPQTAAWHYINFPRNTPCEYESRRLCIEGKCVVNAIEDQLAVIASAANQAD
jgi:nuclease S1